MICIRGRGQQVPPRLKQQHQQALLAMLRAAARSSTDTACTRQQRYVTGSTVHAGFIHHNSSPTLPKQPFSVACKTRLTAWKLDLASERRRAR